MGGRLRRRRSELLRERVTRPIVDVLTVEIEYFRFMVGLKSMAH
jgi:hypothetical protein